MKRSSSSTFHNELLRDSNRPYLDFRIGRNTAAAAAAVDGDPLPDNQGGSPSHILDFRIERNPTAAYAAAAAAPVPAPSIMGRGVSELSSSSSSHTASCFENWNTTNPSGVCDLSFGLGRITYGNDNRSNINTAADDDNDDDDDATNLIAKEISRLSLPERHRANEDIHGVSTTIKETPELIARALLQFGKEIEFIPSKAAYDLAKTLNDDYVQDTKLRLMFLRSVRFHPDKAAKRFISWLDWKLKLFGPDKLCQPHIGLEDLTDDARWVVESGLHQILPVRDNQGRAVLFISNQYTTGFFRSKQAALQMLFYILMSHIVDDEVTQRNGMVYIIYNLGEKEDTDVDVQKMTSSHNLDVMAEKKDLGSSIPIRLAALHIILSKKSNSSPMRYWLSWAVKSLEAYVNVRIRIHYGSHIECVYALSAYGLPTSYLPVTSDGELKTNNHKKWIQRRNIKEMEFKTHHQFLGIELPQNNDVLFGQGKPLQDHLGNKRLIEVIQSYLEEYTNAPRINGRTEVARKVIQEIQNNPVLSSVDGGDGTGGRFLRLRSDSYKSGWWEEVTDEEVILEKVRNGFRNTRRRPKKENASIEHQQRQRQKIGTD